jgi:hypothetical protein
MREDFSKNSGHGLEMGVFSKQLENLAQIKLGEPNG